MKWKQWQQAQKRQMILALFYCRWEKFSGLQPIFTTKLYRCNEQITQKVCILHSDVFWIHFDVFWIHFKVLLNAVLLWQAVSVVLIKKRSILLPWHTTVTFRHVELKMILRSRGSFWYATCKNAILSHLYNKSPLLPPLEFLRFITQPWEWGKFCLINAWEMPYFLLQ